MKKIKIISVLVLLILSFSIISSFLHHNKGQRNAEYRWLEEEVTLFVATDLHYLSPELTDHGEYFEGLIESGDGKVMEYCEEVTDAFIRQVIEEVPDALILSGDLTFNGEKASHVALAEKLSTIENAGIPVFVLPGNHDLNNPMAVSFHKDGYSLTESINAQQFEKLYLEYGFGDAICRDSSSLSYIAEITPELWLLMLDVNTEDSPGILTEKTFQWVEKQLQKAVRQDIRVLAVSHQNLMQHNSIFSYGYVMENNERLLEIYESYGVICNLSGHMHIQHIMHSKEGFTEIATSSLMVSPDLYGRVTLKGKTVAYSAYPLDVCVIAPAQPDFPDYAETFLWENAYRQAEAELTDTPEKDSMCRFFADINTAYLSGKMSAALWDDRLFQQWQAEGTFLSFYLQSILEDEWQDYTEYSFDFP